MGLKDIPVTHMRRQEAIDFLDQVARGLAMTFGPTCETLVQEITEGHVCTVLSIYNGQVSGRSAGSTLSIYGSDTLLDEKSLLDIRPDDAVCTSATAADGRRVKSSSWYLRGHGYVLVLGINMDVTQLTLASDVLSAMATTGIELRQTLTGADESSSDASDIISDCLKAIGKPIEALNRTDKIVLVRLLSERNFFERQHCVTDLASALGVSKGTVYNYLKEAGKNQ